MLIYGGHKYVLVYKQGEKNVWRCNSMSKFGCKAGATTIGEDFKLLRKHNHPRKKRGVTLNVLTQNGFIYNRIKDDDGTNFIPIDYYETSRGAKGILCDGHYFVKEKAFGKSINWHCILKKKRGCSSRGVTSYTNPMVMKLTKSKHNHPVEKRDYKILPISALFSSK
ncbi:hypothetical protein PVAND_002502 [Polypedilum vanderplanki]|uniref:FLYWCH-type domain-containing protein n=1 Tax=Polypedilum vanderplanki TaxID=319348 RepID=A0A9J6BRK1_POLVA|nr:hypothetical protein PVAND_002502 [Polypedilum vanderplanki]